MPKSKITIVLAQLNFTVGDISGNCQKIIRAAQRARAEFAADIVVYSELAITGYPPEDLLLRPDFLQNTQEALTYLSQQLPEMILIVGYPEFTERGVFNSAAVLSHGKIMAKCRKQLLPNYGVFDEKRYFQTPDNNDNPCIFTVSNQQIGVMICEDLWEDTPAQLAKQAGAQLLISLNASPFDQAKASLRHALIRKRIQETGLPILYVNQIGGQDDLIFDGASFAMDSKGKIIAQAGFAIEELLPIYWDRPFLQRGQPNISEAGNLPHKLSKEAQIYQALVLGVRDYVRKNGFAKVLLGFSGGIDSAFTLAIAVDALGKENVLPVLLPSRFTTILSSDAAQNQLKNMGMTSRTISIEPSFNALLSTLEIDPKQPPNDLTIQNLQARCRGIILMALSNQSGALLLNTSNKSEIAVGYGTLYGDLAGAYAVLKDVWKTEVYQIANYRNSLNPVIPSEIINRPPSAELAPNQRDVDSLPAYAILDPILQRYVEQDQSAQEIIAAGFDPEMVYQILKLVNQNEYKRYQSPPGPRVTPRAFTRERRYPLTQRINFLNIE